MGLGKYLLKEGEGSLYQNSFVCDVCFLNLLAILPYLEKKRRQGILLHFVSLHPGV